MTKEKIKELSDLISTKSIEESHFHPIDRYFLQPYIEKILNVDRDDFLIYNFENKSNLYSTYLMLCLPEMWSDTSIDDILRICMKFTNSFSFFGLIYFTYKYIEIDLIELILKLPNVKLSFENDIITWLKSQYFNFFKDETDLLFFEEKLIGVTNEEWMYIKQKLLIDKRVLPAHGSLDELKNYVHSLSESSLS